MGPRASPGIDAVLLTGIALTGGGLAVVAPWHVVVSAASVLVLARRRLTTAATLLVLAGLALGAARAARAVSHHEAERAKADAALGLPRRCTALVRVASSPVEARDTLRWDGWLEHVRCDDAPVGWEGLATLYGGPEGLARGDEAEVVVPLGAPQRLWNASGGVTLGRERLAGESFVREALWT